MLENVYSRSSSVVFLHLIGTCISNPYSFQIEVAQVPPSGHRGRLWECPIPSTERGIFGNLGGDQGEHLSICALDSECVSGKFARYLIGRDMASYKHLPSYLSLSL